jgi:hypothetical protein
MAVVASPCYNVIAHLTGRCAMVKIYYGVGVDDSYTVNARYENGKMTWIDPYFSRWKGIIRRCYAPCKSDASYAKSIVCEDWLYLSNFKGWMKEQLWSEMDLDKDFLSVDHSIYSPETCSFVPKPINYFLGNSVARQGNWPIGVSFDRNRDKYASHIRVNSKSVGLGRFTTAFEAHRAYQAAKINAGLSLIENHRHVLDDRVVNSINVILQKIRDDLDAGRETKSLLPINLPEFYKSQIRETARGITP